MENKTTIKKLFHDESIQFAIPAYQRAYSWEYDKDKKQIKQFILDIKEQNPKKKYFLGHFLFEKDKNDENKYWVIDGQQRLTTVVIFFSCLIRELEKRESESGDIFDENNEKIELWRISENYIKIGTKYRFSTVNYDNAFFKKLILDNNNASNVLDTASKYRIAKAKKVFEKLFGSPSTSTLDILSWKKIIDDAVITTFIVDDKVQATQIFAFQNDRGKDLTTIEKLKAYLMHTIYAASEYGEPENIITNMESVFSDIYKQSERNEKLIVRFDEDRVLGFHSTAYLSCSGNPLDNVKSKIKNINDNNKKEKWIEDFVHTLKETFFLIEKIVKKYNTDNTIADILILDTQNTMPLLVKLYHYHPNDENAIINVAKIVENILFKLTYKTADYRTNLLPHIANNYQGDITRLENEVKEYSKKGFQYWWNFNSDCKDYFCKNNRHDGRDIKYILWKYENHLREQKRSPLLRPIDFMNKYGAKRLENTIDHITPQSPDFTQYSEDFERNYLHNIGNLILMVWGDNSEKRNHNPVDKIPLFDKEFYSHTEVKNVLETKGVWGETEITERKNRIIEFVIRKWGLS
jgi:hypothetical protein